MGTETIVFSIIFGIIGVIALVGGIICAFKEEHGAGHAIAIGGGLIYACLAGLGIVPAIP